MTGLGEHGSTAGSPNPIADILKPSLSVTDINDLFAGSALGAGWTAQQPGKVTVSGNKINLAFSTSGFYDNQVYRSEVRTEGKITLTVPAGGAITAAHGPIARRVASGACYVVNANLGGNMITYSVAANGTPTQIAAASSNIVYANGYKISLEVIGINPTIVMATATDLNGVHLQSTIVSDNTAVNQVPGSFGFASWTSGSIDFNNAVVNGPTTNPANKGLVIGCIGDSITYGTNTTTPGGATATPAQMATAVTAQTGLPCTISNQGVSAKTTADWLAAGSLLNPALTVFKNAGVNVVNILLGTNDVKHSAPVATATSIANVQAIAASCLAVPGIRAVILHGIPFHGVLGTDFGGNSRILARAFNEALPGICTGTNGTGVLLGDMESWGYFASNYSQISDGLHPNDAGAAAYGKLWARAIRRVLGL